MGPCCCKDNVQASFILGIVRGVFSFLSVWGGSNENPTISILYTWICGILVLGASKRNSTLLIVWRGLAVVHLLYKMIYLIQVWVWPVSGHRQVIYQLSFLWFLLNVEDEIKGAMVVATTISVLILFDVWTVIVVNTAIKEIEEFGEDDKTFSRFSKVDVQMEEEQGTWNNA